MAIKPINVIVLQHEDNNSHHEILFIRLSKYKGIIIKIVILIEIKKMLLLETVSNVPIP